MKKRKLRVVIVLLVLFILALVFHRQFYRAMTAGRQIMEGEKTVAQRIDEYGEIVRQRLIADFDKAGVSYPPSEMVLIGLKAEKLLEVWVSQDDGKVYQRLKTYPILKMSGQAGPKLREGDLQVPEGLYRIESLNPNSSFHLSLRINYPNDFDREKACQEGRTNPGGDIMIHGSRVSIGCLAMGNTAAEDLFILGALTQPEHIRVILSPVDFRVREFEGDFSRMPDWAPQFYGQIKNELEKFQ